MRSHKTSFYSHTGREQVKELPRIWLWQLLDIKDMFSDDISTLGSKNLLQLLEDGDVGETRLEQRFLHIYL